MTATRPHGVAPLLERAIARAPQRQAARERAAVAAEVETLARTCRRVNDAYVWLEAYGLVAQVTHAIAAGLHNVEELLDDLDQPASTHGMRELQAEAAMLRVTAVRARPPRRRPQRASSTFSRWRLSSSFITPKP